MTSAGEVVLAHHPILFAVPAFVPAVVVVAVVLYIARKDRLEEAQERALSEHAADPEEDA